MIVQRIVFGQQQAGGSKSGGPDSDEWKAMKAELKSLKGELTSTKQELKAVKDKVPKAPKAPGGEPVGFVRNAICFNCGKKGHLERDCQEPRKSDAERAKIAAAAAGPLALEDKSGKEEDG